MARDVVDPEFTRNVIEGLETACWGGGRRENSVLGALEAALQAIGEEIPYEFLMGVSGGAFRVQIHQPEWCPSAPHANCGFRLYAPLAAALRFELVHLGSETQGDGEGRRAPRPVIESIDRGVPAFYSREEESLVVGYEKGGREVLLRPHAARKEGYVPHTVHELLSDWGGFEVLRRKDRPPDRRQALIRSLEIAVELAHTEAYEDSLQAGGKHARYASGFAAYAVWTQGLRDGSSREGAQMCGNAYCYTSLIDARRAAAVYLDSIASELGADAQAHLLRAAERYREIGQVLMRRSPVEVAPQPWFPNAKSWSQRLRDEQADLLEESLALERGAVSEIERALEALQR